MSERRTAWALLSIGLVLLVVLASYSEGSIDSEHTHIDEYALTIEGPPPVSEGVITIAYPAEKLREAMTGFFADLERERGSDKWEYLGRLSAFPGWGMGFTSAKEMKNTATPLAGKGTHVPLQFKLPKLSAGTYRVVQQFSAGHPSERLTYAAKFEIVHQSDPQDRATVTPVVDVSVAIEGPIGLAIHVTPVAAAERGDAPEWLRNWAQHRLILENTTAAAIEVDDFRFGKFVGAQNELGVTYGCGMGGTEGQPVSSVCTMQREINTIDPYSGLTGTVQLYKGLEGMGELKSGTFTHTFDVRYTTRAPFALPQELTSATLKATLTYVVR